MISLVIIALSFSGVLWMQKASWRNTTATNKTLQAGQMIEQRIEEIRTKINLDTNTFALLQKEDTSYETVKNITIHRVLSKRDSFPALPQPNHDVRKATFTAFWVPKQGIDTSLTVVTYFSKCF
jgi:hypothetical protein